MGTTEKINELTNKYRRPSHGFGNCEDEVRNASLEIAQWKDEQLPQVLLRYTKWLERRGAFEPELCIDWKHQIDTFLKDFNHD